MSKIQSLTPEQELEMIAFREKWRKIGLSTGPANLRAIRPTIDKFYMTINKKPPIIWHCKSPLTAVVVINLWANLWDNLWANLGDNLGENLENNLWDNLGDNLEDNLRANLWDNLGENLRANLGANLWDNLGDNLRANLWANLGANLRDNLRANLRDNLRANLWENLGDNLRANLWANLGANLRDNLRANLWDNLRDNLGENLGDNLGDNLGENLENNLWANLGANLGDNLRANLGDNLRANLGDNLRDNLWDNLGANLGENLENNLWANLGDNLRDNSKIEFIPTSLWGSLDSNWISFYLYPHEKLRPMHTDDQMIILNHWKNLAENSFWWYPFENVCFVCDRPIFIGMDDRWRMHNDSGPAVTFSDGWKIYAVHGVMVPEYVIERPQEITVSKIDAETNVEIRRVMIDQIGAENYLFASGSKIYIEDDFGTLFRREVANDELIVIVEVKNSTPEQDGTYKNYYLRVPPDMATPRQAIAWTFGLQEHEYKPEVQS